MPTAYDTWKTTPDEPSGDWERIEGITSDLNNLLSEIESDLIAESYYDEERGDYWVNIRKSGWTTKQWHEEPGNVARLCKWLVNVQGFEAADLLGVLEKPWNWGAEFEAMQKEAA